MKIYNFKLLIVAEVDSMDREWFLADTANGRVKMNYMDSVVIEANDPDRAKDFAYRKEHYMAKPEIANLPGSVA